ncbi:glycine C-acetyltransferase [Candidatus Woesebacteria bacterium]|nr:glycine C-acetyltransferase [Candidatus Woesebacteria bacterium]
MNKTYLQELTSELENARQNGTYNNIRTVQSQQGAYLTLQEKEYLNLSSNNYLGFASHPRLKQAAQQAIESHGVGTASVRALIGTNDLHITLEKKLAEFKKADDAIVVTSGYLANMAAIQTLLDKDDVVISDELNHASIIDAVKLAGITHKFIYRHSDIDGLRTQLEEAQKITSEKHPTGRNKRVLIVTDGVFSMDGDMAKLPEIVDLAEEFGAITMVDDAHGEGMLGSHGRGIVDHFNLHGRVDIEVGTLSKAFGVLGGFITGTQTLIDWYHQKARQFLFSNALSIPDTAALIEAVTILEESDEDVKKLWENAEFLKKALQEAGFNTGNTQTPIIPVMIGDELRAAEYAKKLYEKGIIVSAIKFPMVAKGAARLRLQPSAIHTQEDLEKGIEAIIQVGKEMQIV